ncbi:prolyl oligopeptidase family serine peptidase [Halomonas sp. McH1-25]|uniref:alpha/beta hydrolase n=1 Tax=unclassified Halomonas TaxID=2609666 RepID=UPI001EF64815|nr:MULTISPECIES: alpha/beta hydrolase-fold protein [unclassified Halomonas]MCG7600354.1 prolyl oligopeptidase family serine peptidase [Halomonas sp. McH1-25]MCP1344235.1 alpha/beta hydrolase-fold protein [Halomonas sp. FL8]MCP1361480.1 alpha/beta hydrolase-fold protein [Halomonas sp. BBD45]MCP1365278.1 alpha/beta hydrolase-fold protein [Halomonas sp. BBD48]
MSRSRFLSRLLYCLLLVSAMAHSQDTPAVTLPGTQAFTLQSPQTGGDYLIQVSVPGTPAPKQGYAVLYVLDGNARLPLLHMARDTLTRQGPYGGGSPLLIVGIGYPDTERFDVSRRALDYTPPTSGPAGEGREQGGAERFLAFIEQTLKPAMAERFPIDASREALMGHSYGGLFVMHVLHTAPQSFERYIAISPSLWWQHRQVLDALTSQLDSSGDAPVRHVLIGVGELEQTPAAEEADTPRAQHKRTHAMVDNARRAAQVLQRLRPQWVTRFDVYPDEDHGNVMWPAAQEAIDFLKGWDTAEQDTNGAS